MLRHQALVVVLIIVAAGSVPAQDGAPVNAASVVTRPSGKAQADPVIITYGVTPHGRVVSLGSRPPAWTRELGGTDADDDDRADLQVSEHGRLRVRFDRWQAGNGAVLLLSSRAPGDGPPLTIGGLSVQLVPDRHTQLFLRLPGLSSVIDDDGLAIFDVGQLGIPRFAGRDLHIIAVAIDRESGIPASASHAAVLRILASEDATDAIGTPQP